MPFNKSKRKIKAFLDCNLKTSSSVLDYEDEILAQSPALPLPLLLLLAITGTFWLLGKGKKITCKEVAVFHTSPSM